MNSEAATTIGDYLIAEANQVLKSRSDGADLRGPDSSGLGRRARRPEQSPIYGQLTWTRSRLGSQISVT